MSRGALPRWYWRDATGAFHYLWEFRAFFSAIQRFDLGLEGRHRLLSQEL